MFTDVKIKSVKVFCMALFGVITHLILGPIETVWMAISRLFEKIGLISLPYILYKIHRRFCDWYDETLYKKFEAEYEDLRSDVYVIYGIRLKELDS